MMLRFANRLQLAFIRHLRCTALRWLFPKMNDLLGLQLCREGAVILGLEYDRALSRLITSKYVREWLTARRVVKAIPY